VSATHRLPEPAFVLGTCTVDEREGTQPLDPRDSHANQIQRHLPSKNTRRKETHVSSCEGESAFDAGPAHPHRRPNHTQTRPRSHTTVHYTPANETQCSNPYSGTLGARSRTIGNVRAQTYAAAPTTRGTKCTCDLPKVEGVDLRIKEPSPRVRKGVVG
jgi:hypothetical protein